MSTTGVTFRMAERDTLVLRHREARARYNRNLDAHVAKLGMPAEIGIDESSTAYVATPEYAEALRAQAALVAIEREYFDRLPRVAMAPCPHCEKPLYRTFDPFGLDGLWWRSDACPDEPAACPHFCVLLGAVDLGAQTQTPRPDFDVHPGPGAPFVMPRLLAQPGMVAVVSELVMGDGVFVYPVAYFAPRRPPVQELAASWARTNFVYTTQLGAHAWRRADEPPDVPGEPTWDFALGRWVASGQLRWCEPRSDRTTLAPAGSGTCPFLGHTGIRSPQLIRSV